ncbi:torsin-1A [Hydra vulgaris]|uniref:torsin-1A n=1 Tax=Hydra vulgaris TaxID=6087 RepID=UPI0032EA6FF9
MSQSTISRKLKRSDLSRKRVDKTEFNVHTKCTYDSLLRGTPAILQSPANRGKNVSLICAVSTTRVLAYEIKTGGWNADSFCTFITTMMAPAIRNVKVEAPVLVMDNCIFHWSLSIRQTLASHDPCEINEICDHRWINQSLKELKEVLRSKVFGQHLINDLVGKYVIDHIENDSPKSPLVMSFHGCTGSGKNYVSQIIANSLFKKGTHSKYFHLTHATKDFPNEKNLAEYKNNLSKHVENNARLCERALFIFDEFHLMPEGLGNSIAPYLDYNGVLGGIDYRKSMFIFLSNSASEIINNHTIKHYKSNKSRETIRSKELEELIAINAINLPGGFKNSTLIERGLINVYVPFLPLERKHVIQCVNEEIRSRNKKVDYSTLEAIADNMHYFPDEKQLFSKYGCKQIIHKVTQFLKRVFYKRLYLRLYIRFITFYLTFFKNNYFYKD